MLGTGFSDWPSFSEEEADNVKEVLLSNRVNYWTGPHGKAFEKEFADFVGVSHAVAVANGTVALDLALLALGIGEGDEVIVTPRSFIASASSIVNVGAIPVFVDVDQASQNINAETIRAGLSERTRAIVCVHISGWPCEMDEIMALARKHDLKVIEDCAQAHGASYRGRSVGSIGDVGAWSFCQDKIMTTGGEGGMITTNSAELWEKMWSLKDHGKSLSALEREAGKNGFRWVHETFGGNARMTEMQSVVGRIQLGRMADWHQKRVLNSQQINRCAAEYPDVFRVPEVPGYMEHAWYKCHIFIQPTCVESGWSRDRVLETIQSFGVPCFQGSCSEMYREQAFADAGLQPKQPLPVAQQLGETSLMFLVHPTLTKAEISKTCDAIRATARAIKGID